MTDGDLIWRESQELRRGALVIVEHIISKTTATVFRAAKDCIISNDISGFLTQPYDGFLHISALTHRKLHAQVHFVSKVHLPIEEESVKSRIWCSCSFKNDELWCSHIAALMLLVSLLQRDDPLIQPDFDRRGWKPKPGHPLLKLKSVQEICLPWPRRLHLMLSTDPADCPERRRSSLSVARVTQTYILDKEKKSKKRQRTSSALPAPATVASQPTAQRETSSWATALARCRTLISQPEIYSETLESNSADPATVENTDTTTRTTVLGQNTSVTDAARLIVRSPPTHITATATATATATTAASDTNGGATFNLAASLERFLRETVPRHDPSTTSPFPFNRR
jgi:hypothetical protein